MRSINLLRVKLWDSQADTDNFRDLAIKRAFVSGAGAKLLSTIVSLVSVGAATHFLGANAYGVVAVIVGLTGLFGFLDFGIGNSLVTDLAGAFALRKIREMRSAITNSLSVLAFVGLLVILIGIPSIVAMPNSALFPAPGIDPRQIKFAIGIYIVIAGLTLPFNVGPRMAIAFQSGALISVFSLIASFVTLALVFFGIASGLSLDYFVFSFVAVPAFANVILTLYVFKRYKRFAFPSVALFRLGASRSTLIRGLPYLALGIAGAVSYQTDVLIVAYILSSPVAAVFGIATRIFSALTQLFIGGIQQMWGAIAHALAQGNHEWVRRRFWRTLLITMVCFSSASIVIVLAGPALIPLWAGVTISPSGEMLLAFAIWNTYNFGIAQFSFLLNGAGKVWSQAVPALVMMIINVPLSIWLTARLGLVGPLYGSLISHALTVGWITVVISVRMLRKSVKIGSLDSKSSVM